MNVSNLQSSTGDCLKLGSFFSGSEVVYHLMDRQARLSETTFGASLDMTWVFHVENVEWRSLLEDESPSLSFS